MQFLKADTAVKVVIGPVVAVGDGFTPVTTLSLSTADEAELLKHDAAAVTDISGNTFAAITSADGYYNLTLTAGQLDTEGMLTVLVNDDSLCLPVKKDFMVVAANVYDSLFAASGTDTLDVQVTGIGANVITETSIASNALTSAKIAASAIGATQIASDAITAAKIAADAIGASELAADAVNEIVDQVWDELQSAHTTAGSFGEIATEIASILLDTGTDGVVVASGSKTGYSLTATTGLGNQTANITGNLSGSVGSVTGAVGSVSGNVDGSIGSLGAQAKLDVNAEADTAISDAALATAASLGTPSDLNGGATIADNLADIGAGIIFGTAQTGTLSTTVMTTDLTGYADDELIGRVVVWTGGTANGQASDITDYASASGTVTYTAITTAPANGDSFKII